jgi:hypothetical protein
MDYFIKLIQRSNEDLVRSKKQIITIRKSSQTNPPIKPAYEDDVYYTMQKIYYKIRNYMKLSSIELYLISNLDKEELLKIISVYNVCVSSLEDVLE